MNGPYEWLTVGENGQWGADMRDTTPAEMDRRMIIMQELSAGRLVLPEIVDDAELVSRVAWSMRVIYGEREEGWEGPIIAIRSLLRSKSS